MKILLREWDKLYISKEGTLRRKTGEYDQLVLPEKYRSLVYRELHDEMGHDGSEKGISARNATVLLAKYA